MLSLSEYEKREEEFLCKFDVSFRKRESRDGWVILSNGDSVGWVMGTKGMSKKKVLKRYLTGEG